MLNKFGLEDKRWKKVLKSGITRKEIFKIYNDMPIFERVAITVGWVFDLGLNLISRFRDCNNQTEDSIALDKFARQWNIEHPLNEQHPEFQKRVLRLLAHVQNPKLRSMRIVKSRMNAMRDTIIKVNNGDIK